MDAPTRQPTASVSAHTLIDGPVERLSLAQKMGLVEAPPPPPDEEEWEAVVHRAVYRGDALHPCAICHESFAVANSSPQVVLSCSHVFHQTCLAQFEKFIRKSGASRSCPCCRKANYHKRVHYAGMAQIQRHAAARIQAVMRGVLARKRYLTLRLKSNPKFKSDYYFNKLQNMSDAYLNYSIVREKEVDRFLEEIDLQRQRAVADMMTRADWANLRATAWKNINALDYIASTLGQASGEVPTITNFNGLKEGHGGGVDCPICMVKIAPGHAKDVVLLSCSHCFHRTCLATFETFNKEMKIPRCPMCRAGYTKQSLAAPDAPPL